MYIDIHTCTYICIYIYICTYIGRGRSRLNLLCKAQKCVTVELARQTL